MIASFATKYQINADTALLNQGAPASQPLLKKGEYIALYLSHCIGHVTLFTGSNLHFSRSTVTVKSKELLEV